MNVMVRYEPASNSSSSYGSYNLSTLVTGTEKTALIIAGEKGYTDTVRLLEVAGAKQ